MTLMIDRQVYDDMLRAARNAAPLEACGIFAGKGRYATKFYELTNADKSPYHCSMIPEEQFAAVKDMRKEGLKIIGIWHSHPATPPRMSQEDVRLAYTPDVTYVILSLMGEQPSIAGYRMNEGVEQKIEVVVR